MDKRRHPRLRLSAQQAKTLHILSASESGAPQVLSDALATDVSLGGIGFRSSQKLPQGTPVQFQLPGGEAEEPLVVEGKVAWSQSIPTSVRGQEVRWYHYGVQFDPGSAALAALQTERTEAATLAEIGQIVSSTLDIQEVYEQVAAHVRQLIPCDRMAVCTVDLNRDTFTVVYATGVMATRPGTTKTLSGSSFEEVVRSRRGQLFQGEDEQALLARFPRWAASLAYGLRSLISVPLLAQGELVGVLNLRATKSNAYTQHHLAVAEQVGGQIAGAIANALTYAKLKQAQAALQESEARYRAIFSTAGVGMARVSLAGQIVESNRALQAMLGYSGAELNTMNFAEVTHPDDVPASRALFHQLLAGERATYSLEKRYRRQDGRVRWGNLTASLVRDAVGTPQFMIAVVEDITERQEAEAALRQAKEEAEQANRAKSEFLSRMSHELRTPLTAILGFAQLLESDPTDPPTPTQQDSVQHIRKAGDHLLTLINDVLDLARIESGHLALSLESVPLGPVLQEALALVAPLASQHQVQVQDQTRPLHATTVRADRSRLQQVVLNLLTNAIKYNHAGGQVIIRGKVAARKRLRLQVQDTGWGIPADQQAALFAPFERLGAERTAVEGTGIGLTITRRLVALMGGSIEVTSVLGEGSCFTIELPLAARVAVAGSAPESGIPTGKPVAGGSHWTVLYIEDDPSTLALVERILARRPQLKLLTAPQAQMGLELARAHRPDVILLDINLPGMDGYEALGWLRRDEETRGIPVVALSASVLPREVERGLAAGFVRYLTKPINVPELLAALDAVLDTQPPSR